jgi:hypothetical protein
MISYHEIQNETRSSIEIYDHEVFIDTAHSIKLSHSQLQRCIEDSLVFAPREFQPNIVSTIKPYDEFSGTYGITLTLLENRD